MDWDNNTEDEAFINDDEDQDAVLESLEDSDSDEDISDEEREDIRYRISADLTATSLQIFEALQKATNKNQALGILIESLSETLGNFVSLVSEAEQDNVIQTAMQYVEASTSLQHEAIAHMVYGQVGHA